MVKKGRTVYREKIKKDREELRKIDDNITERIKPEKLEERQRKTEEYREKRKKIEAD